MKVTDYIVNFLVNKNIDTVFGYQGSSISHLIDSIYRIDNINFVETRNEQGAAFAATAYAKVKDKTGAALACSGPGAINLINGIADAYYDSVPTIFFTGQVSQKEMKGEKKLRQYGFQETDVIGIVKSITKYAVTIANPLDIVRELNKAYTIANSDRRGPVLIDLPHNIQNSIIDINEIDVNNNEIKLKENISKKDLEYLKNQLNKSRKPIIIIGGGCPKLSNCLINNLKSSHIPIVTSYLGKGKIDNFLKNYCGTLGVYGNRSANLAIKYSDLVISIGSRLDGRQTAYENLQKKDNQNVIMIDIDEEELNKYPNHYHINCDAKIFVETLNREINKKDFSKWLNIIRKWIKRYPIESEYNINEFVNPNQLLKEISNILKDKDYVFTIDVGQNQIWANTSLLINEKENIIQSGGLGAMGYALPAAIGSYFASKKNVIIITGDGGVQMNIQELQTISNYKIPVKIIVLNNNSLGLIRDYQTKALESRLAGSVIGFGNPNYECLAKTYNMDYYFLDNNGKNIEDLLLNDKSIIIEVKISGNSVTYPEIAYGKSIINQGKQLTEEQMLEIKKEVSNYEKN